MIKARILSDSILFKFSSGLIALLSPTARRTYRIELLGRGQRFELPENTPIQGVVRAIMERGGEG